MKKLFKKFWKENLFIVLIMIVTGLSTTLASFIQASILNAIIQFNLRDFWIGIAQLIFIYLFFLLCTYFKIKQTSKCVQKASNYLRKTILKKISQSSPRDFQKIPVGNYTSWLSNDINQIEQAGLTVVYELLGNIINLIFALCALLFIHWSIFLLAVVQMVLMIQLPRIMEGRMKTVAENVSKSNEKAITKTTGMFAGFSTFYLLKNLSYLKTRLGLEFDQLADAKNRQVFVMAIVIVLGGLGNIIGQVSSYALAGYLALQSIISIGIIPTVASLCSSVFNTVGNLSQYIATIKSIEPLIEKILMFSKIEPQEIGLNEDNIVKGLYEQIDIEIKKLSFAYEGKENSIDNLSYIFENNKKYAIVGSSGSGKSTLLNLLNGTIRDYQGSIRFNRQEIKTKPAESILDLVTHIEQNPYVFEASLRENLCLGDSFTDEDITKALMHSGLPDLSNKLDLPITENGHNLSGGQKQRISLARGLLRQKRIIFLDESTSSIDEQTALSIEKFLVNLPNVMVIMITHHLRGEIKAQLDGILQL